MRRILIVLLAGTLMLAACQRPQKVAEMAPAAAPPTPEDLLAAADGYNSFALDLHRHLPAAGNLFYSPAGIRSALALAWTGADGNTATQMQNGLHLEGSRPRILQGLGALNLLVQNSEGPSRLSMANRLWGQEGFSFRENWIQETKRYFSAGFEEADFRQNSGAERRRINTWVAENTGNRITDLLPPAAVNKDTRLVLTNAVHFLAPWKHPFKKSATMDREFHTPTESVKVPTMSVSENFSFFQDPEMTLLGLPYEGGDYDLVIILPAKRDGLPALEKALDWTLLQPRLEAMEKEWLHVQLPRLETESKLDLATVLPNMGMGDAFAAGKADFGRMVADDRLHLDAALHRSYLRVDEEGTEAAAATGLTFGITSMPPAATPVHVDHPFLLLIRQRESGVILFMGRIEDPREN